MATLSFPLYPNVKANLPNTILVCGRITLDPATPTVAAGKGFTVSKPGTGVYRVTFNRKPGHIIAAPAMYHSSTAAAEFLDSAIISDANGYVDFRTKAANGTATDFAAGREISFIIVLMKEKLPQK